MTIEEIKQYILQLTPTDKGCIEWTLYTSNEGYGIITIQGLKFKAHRIVYSIFNQCIVEETDVICHKCDNKKCVNPEHLYKGTHKTNMEDKMSRNRFHNIIFTGEIHGSSKLTDIQVIEIKQKHSKGISQTKLAKEYKVNQSQISRIVNGKRRQFGSKAIDIYK